MTTRDFEFFTPPEIAVGTHFHAQNGTKTTPAFLLADGEPAFISLSQSQMILQKVR